MRKGVLTRWKDDRGFGFIKSRDGSTDIFIHISDIKVASRRPKVGDTIIYELTTTPDGKIRATKASIEGVAPLPVRQQKRFKKQSLMKKIIGLPIAIIFVVLAIEFQGSRSPSLINSFIKPGCKIKGNISINTGRRWYHVPGAEDYESTVINPTKGEKWFCTESEAVANGWRKAPR
ncbi:cold shock domain-containing protein [Okeanomitos corallinicola TIOX110]|uniref:Cold shock domain-containing protein n=1 Tax=Okeanomitos corallinicola TIOX110 TaxID=3133117 RepID=A0ABZ2US69_9CYAN